LSRISEAITSDLYLDDILKFIVTVTAELFQSKICSLMLLDDSSRELVVKATQSISEDYLHKPNIKLGTGIAGRVAQNGKELTVADVKKDRRYICTEIARQENLCSLLSVPLFFKGSVIGVLNCYTTTPHTFTASEKKVIQSIASQAAVVIANFKLVVESQVIKEELEARKLIETAKRLLMEQEGISEREAYNRMRQYSMNTRRSMRVVAEAIVLTQKANLADLKPMFLRTK
ncbi:MAG: GAF and ANTAR domain-containing protein, partial [Desulfuromonadaceae bacterium]|nr:GAF and ANTAR domain-containing protein [Desulfuromonadaceae bacterium]